MCKEIYFDNSSTTKVCDEAILSIVDMMSNNYGNTDSLHEKGYTAEKQVEKARAIIANKLNCLPDEIYFTSGGTESNNMSIFGAVKAKKRLGNKIVTSSIEHPSVLNCMKELETLGYEVIYLSPNSHGIIDYDDINNAVDTNTILLSIMMVNNEIGSIQHIDKFKKIVKSNKSPALIHTDAVQAFGKLSINVSRLGLDLLSLSSHKIHGPKGIGALYIKKGTNLKPITFGGNQEKGLRSGTRASQNIVGFGTAVESLPNITDEFDYISSIRNYMLKKLSEIENIKINSFDESLPYIVNFSVGNIRSETLLHFLESKKIYVSSGSACAKGKPSYVLSELKIPVSQIDSSIRVSFSRFNTCKEIDVFIEAIKEALNKLVSR